MRLALLAAATLAAFTAGCVTPRPAAVRPSSPAVGRPAELSGPDLAGRAVNIGEDVGKVRVVDFWATWCEPCREQLPFLDRLSRELGPRGLSVYGVATDEQRGEVEAFLARTPVSFTVLLDPAGETLARPLAIDRLPTTLLVDRKGIVRDVHLGYESSDAAWLEARVRELLAE
jgi:cytochrome c biogenesis protein CcmG/thiol:disulfide interchange protein DsbE